MQQVTDRPAPPAKRGLFRRLLMGEARPEWTQQPAGEHEWIPPRRAPGPDLIDLGGPSPSEWRSTAARLDHLEQGLAVLADTLRRSIVRLGQSIGELREGPIGGTDPSHVEQVVADALQPLRSAVDELARSVHRFPFVLAAAAGQVTERVESVRPDLERSVPLPTPRASSPDAERASAPSVRRLPVVPFELESVEDEFDSLTALRRARFEDVDAESIWGSDASSA